MRPILFAVLVFLLSVSVFATEKIALDWSYRIYQSQDLSEEASFIEYSSVPLSLNREFKGFIEYQATFKTPKNSDTDPMGIYLRQVGDVDKVYVNGQLVGQTGDFPPHYTYNMDVIREYVIPGSVLIPDGQNQIRVVTYVEYFTQKGLKLQNVVLGRHRELQQKKYATDIFEYSTRIVIPFLCFVLLILSIPWRTTRKLKGQFYLFSIALSGMIFGICRTRIPFHFFETLDVYKVTIGSSIATVLFILLYTKEMSFKKVKILSIASIAIASGFILAVCIQSDLSFAAIVAKWWFKAEAVLVTAHLYLVLKDKGFSALSKIGYSALFLFVMNDVLRDLRFINTPPLFHVGVGAFVSAVIIGQIYNLKVAWSNYIRKELELESEAKFGRTIAQIAHDLRSPFEVLKTVKSELNQSNRDLSYRFNLAMNRMEEITENLLNGHKKTIQSNEDQGQNLFKLIEEVVTEKKIEFQNRSNLRIMFKRTSEDTYSSVRPGQFKRIISNLINNAVEATDGEHREIEVRLSKIEKRNIIEISDNGNGISKEDLGKIFTKGFTTKRNGNGIGLFSAKEQAQIMGGNIQFETAKGFGSTFKLSFEAVLPPKSLIDKIDIVPYQKIIILDDDPGFHEVWKSKIIQSKDKLVHFHSISELLKSYPKLDQSVLLLSDLELMDKEKDGIDLILHLAHAANSVLITAMAEDAQVKDRCHQHNIKLIPKTMISQVQISESPTCIILIDDEELTQISWNIYFENRPVQFTSFYSVDEFLQKASDFNTQTTMIYIDSNLGELRGEVESEKIFNLGFKNLYMETGSPKGAIQKPSWILKIHPKTPKDIFG